MVGGGEGWSLTLQKGFVYAFVGGGGGGGADEADDLVDGGIGAKKGEDVGAESASGAGENLRERCS